MAQDFQARRPDYNVSALDKDHDTLKGGIGVAWKQADGTIRIKLNPFVILDTREHDLVITLFPTGDMGKSPPATKKSKEEPREIGDAPREFDGY